MNHLAYDDEDENLTVVIKSDAGTTFCETKVNSVLIKMMSPWWKAKLTSGGFKDSVQDSRCVIVHENPRVAELALDAAKFRLQQADLVAEGDLNLAYTTWQLADMWQFGYLSSICQGALQDLLKDLSRDVERLEFVKVALNHNDAILEEVLVPFFVDHPEERKTDLYLAFSDRVLLRLAEVAPIAGFQSRSQMFRERFRVYASGCDDSELTQYMQHNPEARNQQLFLSRSFECCVLLFAAAPLPFVKDMVHVALQSSWTAEEKELALSAINYSRVTSIDHEYLRDHHPELPQHAYIYRALWLSSQRRVSHPAVTISSSAPWTIHCCHDDYTSNQQLLRAGPIKFTRLNHRQSVFSSDVAAYGLLYRCRSDYCVGVVQAAKPFIFGEGSVLIVYESFNNAMVTAVSSRQHYISEATRVTCCRNMQPKSGSVMLQTAYR